MFFIDFLYCSLECHVYLSLILSQRCVVLHHFKVIVYFSFLHLSKDKMLLLHNCCYHIILYYYYLPNLLNLYCCTVFNFNNIKLFLCKGYEHRNETILYFELLSAKYIKLVYRAVKANHLLVLKLVYCTILNPKYFFRSLPKNIVTF